MNDLLLRIRQCTHCQKYLPLGPRPLVQASIHSRIAIIGQAPGQKTHERGIPWEDQSGERLRDWLGVSREQFYDPDLFAFLPMGFCYPGKGRSGDLPPRPECAPLWHPSLLDRMPGIRLTLLIGMYAQKAYLGPEASGTITENVKRFSDFLPAQLPLIHPSPRNQIWLKKNPWFTEQVLPALRSRVSKIISEL